MVIIVFQEPSGARIEDVNTLWSGLFNSVTSLNLEGVCGLGTGLISCQVENISLAIERCVKLPDVAGHAINHCSNVFFLPGVIADGQDLLVWKIR